MSSIIMDISNCNNIDSGHIAIEKNKLNIKYGINGVGKSTLALALESYCKQKPLDFLKPFGAGENDKPNISLNEPLDAVIVFNEDYVNNIVFQESSVIDNAFDVFIKTPDYDERRASLDSRLKALKVNIGNDARIIQLQEVIDSFTGKLELTVARTGLKQNNNLKSIIKKKNLFKVPAPLQKYVPFISDNEISINWIDWKTKGGQFDKKEICPFCSEDLRPSYVHEKEVFTSTYKKADSQNLKNMLELFTQFEKYLDPKMYEELISCVKKDVAESTIKTLLTAFMLEFDHIKTQLDGIAQFDSNVFRDVDIKDLDKLLGSLKIQQNIIKFFYSPLMKEIIDCERKIEPTL